MIKVVKSKVVIGLIAIGLVFTLTGCDKEVYVGEAGFITETNNPYDLQLEDAYDLQLEDADDPQLEWANDNELALIKLKGRVIKTSKGLRYQITKFDFTLTPNGRSPDRLDKFSVVRSMNVQPFTDTEWSFADSILTENDACGWAFGATTDGRAVLIFAIPPASGTRPTLQKIGILEYSSVSSFRDDDLPEGIWFGSAPVKSLRTGGKNLCGWVKNIN